MSAFLRLNIDDSQTTIDIEDTSNFPVNGGVVQIETEEISYTTATPQGILGCTRGYNSTSAASHLEQTHVDLLSTPISNDAPLEFKADEAPTDNLTGVKIAPKGSRYTNTNTGEIYINTNDADEPVWTLLSTGGGATPGGPDMAIQFNDAGTLAGSAAFLFDEDTILMNSITGGTLSFLVEDAETAYIQGFNGLHMHSEDFNIFLETPNGNIQMPGTGYSFTFDANAGSVDGVQSLSGPSDDSLVVHSQGDFELNLGTNGEDGTVKITMNSEAAAELTQDSIILGVPASSRIFMVTTPGLATMSINKGSNADGSSVLELAATDRGFLPPRMTEAQRDAISAPVAGLIVFNTTSQLLSLFDGSVWADLTAGGSQTIPQVFQMSTAAVQQTTSVTYVGIGAFSQAVTMQSATNKLKITLVLPAMYSVDINQSAVIASVFKDGVNMFDDGQGMLKNSGLQAPSNATGVYIDTPGDTSSHTYDVRFRNQDGATNVLAIDGNGGLGVFILEEILS